jgi:hypothetical protein
MMKSTSLQNLKHTTFYGFCSSPNEVTAFKIILQINTRWDSCQQKSNALAIEFLLEDQPELL